MEKYPRDSALRTLCSFSSSIWIQARILSWLNTLWATTNVVLSSLSTFVFKLDTGPQIVPMTVKKDFICLARNFVETEI